MRLSIALSKMILLVAMVLEFFAGFVVTNQFGFSVGFLVWASMFGNLYAIAVLEGLEAIERGIKAERKLLQSVVRLLSDVEQSITEYEQREMK